MHGVLNGTMAGALSVVCLLFCVRIPRLTSGDVGRCWLLLVNRMSLTHKQSWQSHLAFCVAHLVFGYPFILVFLYLFSWETFAVAISAILLVGMTALLGHQIYVTATQRQDFFCAINADRIYCECPSQTLGSSFDLLISDIARIKIDDGRVRLYSTSGEDYWLTSNYGNPAHRFVQLLVEANPAIQVDDQ